MEFFFLGCCPKEGEEEEGMKLSSDSGVSMWMKNNLKSQDTGITLEQHFLIELDFSLKAAKEIFF